MVAMVDRPEVRISVRVDPDLYGEVQRVADEKYEGKFSMAARAAFRLLVNEPDEQAEQAEQQEAKAA